MDKPRVEMFAANGKSRSYTVNASGSVNAACYNFLRGNGGHVPRERSVPTPVKLDRTRARPDYEGTFVHRRGGGR